MLSILRLHFVLWNHFSQSLVGVTVVPRQILKFKLVQNFWGQTRCIMDNVKVANEYLILIMNRTAGTAKEHEGSAPRK